MHRPLTAQEIFPAGSSDITARVIPLPHGLRARVVEGGDPHGKPVVMLHGWGASAYTFRHAFPRLGARGMRVIAVDLRGFGLSDKPVRHGEYSAGKYGDDLTLLLDALGLSSVALVGHSMGGGVALQYALDRPERVRALAAISPTNLVTIPLLVLPRLAPLVVARALGRHLVPRWAIAQILRRIAYGDVSLATDDTIDQYWAPTQLPGYVFAARSTLSEFDWRPITPVRAATLAVPTVVMLGAKDRLVQGAATRARALRGAVVHELDTGHCVHEEAPDRAYDIVGRLVAADSVKS